MWSIWSTSVLLSLGFLFVLSDALRDGDYSGGWSEDEMAAHIFVENFDSSLVIQEKEATEGSWGKDDILLVLFCLPLDDNTTVDCVHKQLSQSGVPREALQECGAPDSVTKCAEGKDGLQAYLTSLVKAHKERDNPQEIKRNLQERLREDMRTVSDGSFVSSHEKKYDSADSAHKAEFDKFEVTKETYVRAFVELLHLQMIAICDTLASDWANQAIDGAAGQLDAEDAENEKECQTIKAFKWDEAGASHAVKEAVAPKVADAAKQAPEPTEVLKEPSQLVEPPAAKPSKTVGRSTVHIIFVALLSTLQCLAG